MSKCKECGADKIYAKEYCSPCYQRKLRLKHVEKRRAYDKQRWLTPHRKEQDKARHYRHKEHRNARCRAYRQKHLAELQTYDRFRSQTPERKQWAKEWTEAHREQVRATERAEYYRNKDKHIARVMARRAHKGKATPKWLSDSDKLLLLEMYKNRPEGYHVDHIIPLQGENVCGLHVPWNLQYLPATENLRKSNKCA